MQGFLHQGLSGQGSYAAIEAMKPTTAILGLLPLTCCLTGSLAQGR